MEVRNLSSEESNKLIAQLQQILLLTVEKWNPYWYPLNNVTKDVSVIAFKSDFMAKDKNLEKIRMIFEQHKIFSAIVYSNLF